MKRSHQLAGLALLAVACYSKKESDLIKFDCATSELDIQVKNSTLANCSQGAELELEATGGSAPYLFQLSNGNFQESPVFTDLSATVYQATVMDVNSCVATLELTISAEPNSVSAVTSAVQSGCGTSDGSIAVDASGGEQPYQYKIDAGSFQASETFTDLSSGSYTIVVRDAQNCEASVTEVIESGASLDADIFPIITESCALNGCHLNDQQPHFTSKEIVIANAARIKSRTSSKEMPPTGGLSDEQIDLISCWVNDGANNN